MKKLELLAPAKNFNCAIAAINAGADAIYIGAGKFGARSAANNDLEVIQKVVSFAHEYYTKVYVTINTILSDTELKEAENLIKDLYNIGIDAIIIQDVAILEMNLPSIPIFASTQMNNDSVEKIIFLQNIGLQRIILPRELSLKDIKDISSKVQIELEAFIHGALCVSYSGQCYMSYSIGKRSANKGECAQPCRKKYTLIDNNNNIIAKEAHLLSLKDLNLSKYIEELIDAGISSFKIEGRLKDEHYISNVVSFYRHQLDRIIEKYNYKRSSSGSCMIDYTPNLDKSFNRGYTSYFIEAKQDNVVSLYTPKSIGEYLGNVKILSKNYFIIDSNIKLSPGDGICFYDLNNTLLGTGINKVDDNKIFPNSMDNIYKGIKIYRNQDIDFNKSLESKNNKRLINIKMILSDSENNINLQIIDEDGNKINDSIETKSNLAKNKEAFLSTLKNQMEKLGNTIFYTDDIQINLNHFNFLSVKQINELRRNAIEKLIMIREQNRPVLSATILKNTIQYPIKDLYFEANIHNNLAKTFYERHGSTVHQSSAESGTSLYGKRLMKTKYCLRQQFGLCHKTPVKKIIKDPLFLLDQHNQKYELKFNCQDCFMEIFLSS